MLGADNDDSFPGNLERITQTGHSRGNRLDFGDLDSVWWERERVKEN